MWWQRHVRSVVAGAAAVLVALLVVGYAVPNDWTGLRGADHLGYRTLWDWLELLVVPVALAALGLWYSGRERSRERREQDRRERAEVLTQFLQRVGPPGQGPGLPSGSLTVTAREVESVAARLDGRGRGLLVRALYEAGFLGGVSDDHLVPGTLRLSGVDLSEAVIDGMSLDGIDLTGARLDRATMRGASLNGARLASVHLVGADLKAGRPPHAASWLMTTALIGADLQGADLSGASLGATLAQANCRYALFCDADLGDTRLAEADLYGADLTNANLRRVTDLDPRQLAAAGKLTGARLPDGSQGSAPQRLEGRASRDGSSVENAGSQLEADLLLVANVVPAGEERFVVGGILFTTRRAAEDENRRLPVLVDAVTGQDLYEPMLYSTLLSEPTSAGAVEATCDLELASETSVRPTRVLVSFALGSDGHIRPPLAVELVNAAG